MSRPTIAVVDDDESIRKSLRRLLTSVGLEVVTFASAEDLKDSIPGKSYDGLVLDVHLPGQNGIELHRDLVHMGIEIPTVFISAHETELSNARESAPPAIDYLLKPFEADDLIDAVQKALNQLENEP